MLNDYISSMMALSIGEPVLTDNLVHLIIVGDKNNPSTVVLQMMPMQPPFINPTLVSVEGIGDRNIEIFLIFLHNIFPDWEESQMKTWLGKALGLEDKVSGTVTEKSIGNIRIKAYRKSVNIKRVERSSRGTGRCRGAYLCNKTMFLSVIVILSKK